MKKYGRFTEDEVRDKIDELPKWAKEFIREQDMRIAVLQRQVSEFEDEQKPSDISWQYLLDIEHFIPQNSHVRFYHDPTDLNYRAYIDVYFRNIGKERVLEIQGTRSLFIEPQVNNDIYIRMEGNKEFYGKTEEEQRDKEVS